MEDNGINKIEIEGSSNFDLEYVQDDEDEDKQLNYLKSIFEDNKIKKKIEKKNKKPSNFLSDIKIAFILTLLFFILCFPLVDILIKKIFPIKFLFIGKLLIFMIIAFIILRFR